MVFQCPHCGLGIEIEETEYGFKITEIGNKHKVKTSSESHGFLFGELNKEGEDDGK